jgi:kinesin family protein 5
MSLQTDLYDIIGRPTVTDVVEGYNGTVLAYGQTGSGKTYTMYGSDIFNAD